MEKPSQRNALSGEASIERGAACGSHQRSQIIEDDADRNSFQQLAHAALGNEGRYELRLLERG